ncbi:hypothetical protein GCM10028825_51770 [Spirosoma agri]
MVFQNKLTEQIGWKKTEWQQIKAMPAMVALLDDVMKQENKARRDSATRKPMILTTYSQFRTEKNKVNSLVTRIRMQTE